MSKSVAALFLVLSAVLAQDRTYYEQKFYSWMKEYMFMPASGEVFVHYLENFIANDKFIEAHNSGNNTFIVGHNQFSHLNAEEWSDYLRTGLVRRLEPVYSRTHTAPVDVSALPTSVDWTTKGAVTGVKDQGQCGSCWSFSATGAIEGASFIKNGKLVSLSEQNFVDCDNRQNGGSDLGCNGGLMDSAFSWAKKNGGVCSEADYPYVSGTTQKAGTCNQGKCTKVATSAPKSYTDVQTNSDSALMSAIVNQPVSVAIEADQTAFQLYKSGVFTAACGTNLDHGVLAVGYGTYSNGLDYYKVKNSWGTSWGMQGYILLQRGVSQKQGQCGILSGPPSYPNM
jgi:C1A family cysteine protease